MKILKSRIILVIITIILTGSISVYAAGKYYANQVEYEPSNPNFNVGNMADALDELYDKTKNYKNLSTPTDVESNYLLNGKKAYKSNGTLVTGSIPTYNGTTNITASSETQTLQTNGKYMNSDITINALPAGSGDCVSGYSSFTSSSLTSEGQELASFWPAQWIVYLVRPDNDSKTIYYFNQNVTGNYAYEFVVATNQQLSFNETRTLDKYKLNNTLNFHDLKSTWLGVEFSYMACH